MKTEIKSLLIAMAFVAGALMMSGCGSGNPGPRGAAVSAATVTVSGRVLVPPGQQIIARQAADASRLSGASGESETADAAEGEDAALRIAELAGEKALPGASISLGRINADGQIALIEGVAGKTDNEGKYQIQGVPVEDNLVLVAMLAVGDATIVVKGMVSTLPADAGATKTEVNITLENTLFVEEMRRICLSNAIAAKDVDRIYAESLRSAVRSSIIAHINGGGRTPDLSIQEDITEVLAMLKTPVAIEGRWKAILSSSRGQRFSDWIFRVDSTGAATDGGYGVTFGTSDGEGALSGECASFRNGQSYCRLKSAQTLGGLSGDVVFHLTLDMKTEGARRWFEGAWSSRSSVFGEDKGAINSTTALDRMEVSPASLTISLGNSKQFTAVVTFVDSATEDVTERATWTSSNESVATVSEGLLETVAAGYTEITATRLGVSSDPVPVIVIDLADTSNVAPLNVVATAGDGMITITWIMPDLEEVTDYLLGFNVYRSETPGAGHVKINDVLLGAESCSYVDADVEVGVRYYYELTAVYDVAPPNESDPSQEATGKIFTDEEAIQELLNLKAASLAAEKTAEGNVVYTAQYESPQVAINGDAATAEAALFLNYGAAGEYRRYSSLEYHNFTFAKSGGVWSVSVFTKKDGVILSSMSYTLTPTDQIKPGLAVDVTVEFTGAGNNPKYARVTTGDGQSVYLSIIASTKLSGYIKAQAASGPSSVNLAAENKTNRTYNLTHSYITSDGWSADESSIVSIFGALGQAVAAEDVDGCMAFYSPEYSHQGKTYSSVQSGYESTFADQVTYSSIFMIKSVATAGGSAAARTIEYRKFDDSPNPEWDFFLGGPAVYTLVRDKLWQFTKTGGQWLIVSDDTLNVGQAFALMNNPPEDYVDILAYSVNSSFQVDTNLSYGITASYGQMKQFSHVGQNIFYTYFFTPSQTGTDTAGITLMSNEPMLYLFDLTYNIN